MEFNELPASLKSMMVILSRGLVKRGIRPTIATEAASASVQEWIKTYSGITLYIPIATRGTAKDIKREILAEYEAEPQNSLEICQKYGISRRWLYQIVQEERDRRAGERERNRVQAGATS